MNRTDLIIMRKTSILTLILFLCTTFACAQERQKFDPKRFEADLEQFIATEAGLTAQQAAAFFPVYKEMRDKQRVLFGRMGQYRHVDTCDDDACAKAIRALDDCEMQIKQLQHQYHLRFMEILPAAKVLKAIRAEERFHRQAFKDAAEHRRGNPKPRR